MILLYITDTYNRISESSVGSDSVAPSPFDSDLLAPIVGCLRVHSHIGLFMGVIPLPKIENRATLIYEMDLTEDTEIGLTEADLRVRGREEEE